jgi:hypothetical protein
MENFMKIYYSLLSILFILAIPLFAMEKTDKRTYEEEQIDDVQSAQKKQKLDQQVNPDGNAILAQFFKAVDICRICNANIDKNKLRTHFFQYHKDLEQKPFKCPAPECKYTTTAWKLAETHIVNHHIEKYKPTSCWICSKKLAGPKAIINHVKQNHPDKNPFKCPQCDHTTNNAFNIKTHLTAIHIRKNKNMEAIQLDTDIIPLPTPVTAYLPTQTPMMQTPVLQTQRKELALESMNDNDDSDIIGYAILDQFLNIINICRICNKNIGKNNLLVHFNNDHKDQEPKPFKCPAPECKYAASTWNITEAHIVDKHIQKYNPTGCWICSKKLTGNTLINHFKQNHPDKKPFKCPQCNHTTNLLYNMTKHISSNHIRKDIMPLQQTVSDNNSDILLLPTPIIQSQQESQQQLSHLDEQISDINFDELISEFNPSDSDAIGDAILDQFLNIINICRICHKNIGRNNLLAHFNNDHKEQEPKPFKCTECTYIANKAYNIIMHIPSHVHNKATSNTNPDDSNTIISTSSHAYLSTRTPDLGLFNSYECTYEKCRKKFSTEEELIEHLDTEHA